MLFCTRRCERAGAAVRWFAAHDRLMTLRDSRRAERVALHDTVRRAARR